MGKQMDLRPPLIYVQLRLQPLQIMDWHISCADHFNDSDVVFLDNEGEYICLLKPCEKVCKSILKSL